MTAQLNIVVLAAGQGKRMFSSLPKVLHPLAGRPLLGHVLATAQNLKPQRCVVVVGHGAEQVQAAFPDAAVSWAKQLQQLGTGHAVQQALPHLADDALTLVLYGDVPLIRTDTLRALINTVGPNTLALLTLNLRQPEGYGRIVRNAQGDIVRIVEQKDASAEEQRIQEVNTGIMVAPTAFFKNALTRLTNHNAQGEYYLTDTVALAVANGMTITSTQALHSWEVEGVNNKVQLAALERQCQRNAARALLEQGVTLADPERIDIRGTLSCGREVFIDVNSLFEGQVHLADGVSVGAHVVLRNVSVGENVRIEPFTHIDGHVVIGAGARIGPFARLRPGTTLAERAHVGNFVEIKNSQIGQDSKINHLSYVGDATVGKRVNIGAGTITCNYDGVNKHRTIIEDDAFIGSDTQLVAPVTVHQGATLGAGTTLTKDAPSDQLTLSRAKQISLSSWKRTIKSS